MKTAVSVPNELFAQADALARSTGRSRSDVYSAALREYVARHSGDEVTESLNKVVADLGGDGATDRFVRRAAERQFERAEW